MAKAHAGRFPGSNIKVSNGTMTSGKFELDLTGGELSPGWHKKRGVRWYKKQLKTGGLKPSIGTDGQVHLFYANKMNDQIFFYAHDKPKEDDLDMAMSALNKSNPGNNIDESDGAGHILHIEYSYTKYVMRVKFESGSICVFFGVPHNIAGELLAIAKKGPGATIGTHQTGPKKGEPRHLLGVRFWELIRIKGSKYGAQYPFEYLKRTENTFTRSGQRYKVKTRDGKIISTIIDQAAYDTLTVPKNEHEQIREVDPQATYIDKDGDEVVREGKNDSVALTRSAEEQAYREMESRSGYEREEAAESIFMPDELIAEQLRISKILDNAIENRQVKLEQDVIDKLEEIKQTETFERMQRNNPSMTGDAYARALNAGAEELGYERPFTVRRGGENKTLMPRSWTLPDARKNPIANKVLDEADLKLYYSIAKRLDPANKILKSRTGAYWSIQDLKDLIYSTDKSSPEKHLPKQTASLAKELFRVKAYDAALSVIKNATYQGSDGKIYHYAGQLDQVNEGD